MNHHHGTPGRDVDRLAGCCTSRMKICYHHVKCFDTEPSMAHFDAHKSRKTNFVKKHCRPTLDNKLCKLRVFTNPRPLTRCLLNKVTLYRCRQCHIHGYIFCYPTRPADHKQQMLILQIHDDEAKSRVFKIQHKHPPCC